MAFRFNWPNFSDTFYENAKGQLEKGLNKGPKPGNICDEIKVNELYLGTVAPEFEILEIGELSMDQFRGMFKIVYQGDAHIVLQTQVQANPVSKTKQRRVNTHPNFGILAANKPLVVPMQLKLSNFKVKGIFSFSISEQRGVTFCFKNEPLESIEVTSTFDSIAAIKRYLQQEITERLNQLLCETLPLMIHSYFKEKKKEEDEQKPKQFPMRRTISFYVQDECPHHHSDSTEIVSKNGIIIRSYSKLMPYDGFDTLSESYNSKRYQTPLMLSQKEFDGLKLCALEKETDRNVVKSFFDDALSIKSMPVSSSCFCSAREKGSGFRVKSDENKKPIEENVKTDDTLNADKANFPILPSKSLQFGRLLKSTQTMSPYVADFQHAKFRSTPWSTRDMNNSMSLNRKKTSAAEDNLHCKSRISISSLLQKK